MSDPFDVLRGVEAPAAPDVAAIKGRARRIQQRQKLVVGASAASVAAIALVAVVLSTGGPQHTSGDLAREESQTFSEDDADRAEVKPRSAGSTTSRAGAEDTTKDEATAPEAAVTESQGGAAVMAPPEIQGTTFTSKVTARPRTLGGADFAFEVCNATEDAVTIPFATAQRYDFRVSTVGGDQIIWEWSDDRVFAQVKGEETWQPKECREWSDSWDGMTNEGARANNGEYEVVGVLADEGQQAQSEPVTFCHGLC